MPAWAITSTVLDSSRSFCLVDCGAGRRRVGPNTIARLCNDILFSASWWFILKVEIGENYEIEKCERKFTLSSDRESNWWLLYLAAGVRWRCQGAHRSSLTRWLGWTGWMCRRTWKENFLWFSLITFKSSTYLLVKLIREQSFRQFS